MSLAVSVPLTLFVQQPRMRRFPVDGELYVQDFDVTGPAPTAQRDPPIYVPGGTVLITRVHTFVAAPCELVARSVKLSVPADKAVPDMVPLLAMLSGANEPALISHVGTGFPTAVITLEYAMPTFAGVSGQASVMVGAPSVVNVRSDP